MRPSSLLLVLALALGACAPSRSAVETPAPSTTGPDVEAQRAAARRANQPLASAPDSWWLLDVVTDGVDGIAVERAYRELLAGKKPRRTVVVAVIAASTRQGPERRDLVNEDSRGNGKDDGRNMHRPGVHGWNFIGGRDATSITTRTR